MRKVEVIVKGIVCGGTQLNEDTKLSGKFHKWVNIGNKVKAVIEDEEGYVSLVDYSDIRFTSEDEVNILEK